jgi:hypothetical protein
MQALMQTEKREASNGSKDVGVPQFLHVRSMFAPPKDIAAYEQTISNTSYTSALTSRLPLKARQHANPFTRSIINPNRKLRNREHDT